MSAKKPSSKKSKLNQLPVRLVGIGASAGGLEALRDLLESLPKSDCLSYVIAQHVSPTHVSMLLNLLAPSTHLIVNDLIDRTEPKAGVIYITLPNNDVILEKGFLRLVPPKHAVGPKPSITQFFYSLAEELGEQAIGIILSGTGSDGASGMRAIKAAGGITIVQDPDTAKYDGMPKSAIHTGSVDLIMAPHEMGGALVRLLEQRCNLSSIIAVEGSDEFSQINNLVRQYTSFKLKEYKSTTVKRRIARRMGILGLQTLGEYVAYMRENKDEAQQLIRDTFISVTEFFRDPDCFEALKSSLQEIVKQKIDSEANTIRCWVPACATGEEVYSIAMLFEEVLSSNKEHGLQYMIFASDMDDNALDHARAGLYSSGEVSSIPAEYRQRYFEVEGDYHRVRKDIRNKTIFARQNVIEDPPFNRLDLISCRNLLIYLKAETQKQIFELFHFSLNTAGVLFLGRSESAESYKDLFKPVDLRARLFVRLAGEGHYRAKSMSSFPTTIQYASSKIEERSTNIETLNMQMLEILAATYAPPSLVVNDSEMVVQFQGDLKPFLDFPRGHANLYLFDMVDSQMRAELRALVYRCRRDRQTINGTALNINIGGEQYRVQPVVRPIDQHQDAMLMVSFQVSSCSEKHTAQENKDSVDFSTDKNSLIIGELERELANTRTHLNIVVEELETSNEELQSLNEELQSANEELQSTNEELQTSNEELQSTNEELLTVNEEIQVKSNELEVMSVDLTNIKQSLTLPLFVVNKKMLITQFNTACSAIIDTSGPVLNSVISSVAWRIDIKNLYDEIRSVMKDGVGYKSTLFVNDKQIYKLFVMPYRSAQGDIVGAVLMFEDITVQFNSERALRESNDRYDLIALATNDGIWDWNIDDEPYWSPRYKALLGYRYNELTSSMKEWERRLHPKDRKHVLLVLNSHLAKGSPYDVEYRFKHKSGKYIWVRGCGRAVRDKQGKAIRMAGSIVDISQHKQITQDLYENQEKFRHAMLFAPIGKAISELDGRYINVNPALCKLFGYSESEMLTRDFQSLSHADDLDVELSNREKLLSGEIDSFQMDKRYIHKKGHQVWVLLNVSLARSELGVPLYFICHIQDISQRKADEVELRLISNIFSNTLDGILITDVSGIIQKANPALQDILGYSPDEIAGQHIKVLRSQKHDDSFYEHMWETIRVENSWQGEVWDRHKEGYIVPVWLSITAISNGKDELQHYVAFMHDISEQKLSQERIHHLAHYDVLTGLPNRVLLLDRLSQALTAAKRNQNKLALLFIDLDRFKQINDSRGHSVGDELLVKVAERITTHVRDTDTLSRLSGDEFVLLVDNLSTENHLKKVASKVLHSLSQPFELAEGQVYLTASIGIAVYPNDGDTPDLLLRHADLAMYKSKESGRNRFHFYTEEMGTRIKEQIKLHTDLRNAIEDQALTLHYQPIMDIGTGACIGAEALVRWKHPKMGWIEPEKFIPIAEDNDLIGSLGEWVLLTACRQMRQWLDDGIQLKSLSVNVSGKQIITGNFVNAAHRAMKETDCPKDSITLELTESLMMEGSESVLQMQHQLRDLGFGLSIDDFGTGFSSLNYLKRMPLTQLKLDRSFVMGIPDNVNDVAIAQTILVLGHKLGLEIVAEGVEGHVQHDFLSSVKCELGQGFYYAKPMPANKMTKFFATAKLN